MATQSNLEMLVSLVFTGSPAMTRCVRPIPEELETIPFDEMARKFGFLPVHDVEPLPALFYTDAIVGGSICQKNEKAYKWVYAGDPAKFKPYLDKDGLLLFNRGMWRSA